ncbi:cystathionine beta-lyase PatB [Clostridium pasteurianum DSM 525 = ATCC 6013]|uniref:cysteine-S-conjugate beta-lyase n=1 Tax=Clostridium pasteurianum DSM 525 = ATCC 6013 TaxID=1262449 RepID=A0A0H3J8K8_CLOPA|nr:PatB family C-S lyase [Clostridium pasteurianum]AJA47405.1 cystathionine beta-lyase PatB [Clostridium pasteurianum DSM 525 = ATCC 6013]AJA51393.1 cystathionine beta-lyase PatB [Clostridium pasteurianum DSM 525 = ATCC 6013]AOZ74732.1 cystathionine beta-lyase [Clostridium pasteurianum DSM 525 = ATCC 6013]AOZ78528.1 cystathionine beta-lyase [Clostridium pasteurianum]ELP58741.1 cystathionine beta-lyase [Clostridium pasteurianum DSM 525 = ATCC 6013]
MNFDFDSMVNRRGTNSIKWDTVPEDYIPLFIADMDFKSPPAVIEALGKRVANGFFGYTKPGEEVYDAIFKWFYRTYGFQLKKSWITWLPGVVPALRVASAMGGGDVITNTPNYSMLLSAPIKAGRRRIDSPLKLGSRGYEIDFEDLEKRITPETRVFLLCNPHNPVGRIYTREELFKVAEFCHKHDLILVSDEIHCELVFDRAHIPTVTTGDIALERSITLMSPGKTYNLPGIPIAFAIIPNRKLKKAFEAAGYAMPHPGPLNYEVCRAAYGESEEWKRELLGYLKNNRDYLEGEFAKRFPKVIYNHSEGTYLVWIDFRPLGIENPFQYFYDKAKIVFTDGKDFGEEGFVRLNFACPRKLLEQALDRIEEAVKEI